MKPNFKLILIIVFFTISSINVYAQSFELRIYSKDNVNSFMLDSISYNKYHLDKKSILKELDSISRFFSIKGFINNNYFLKEKDSLISAQFSLNTRIKLIRVYYNGLILPPNLINQVSVNYNNLFFELSTETIQDKLNIITKHYEKQGFTFVKTSLKNLSLTHNILEATLNVETSAKRTVNNVIIKGYDKFPEKYLKHYLGIKENVVFNSSFLQKTAQLINTIPFVTQLKNPEILFTKDSTSLYLYLDKKKSSQFDGLMGFSNSKNNILKINGYLNLILINIFDKGEQISINWKNNGDKNTTLNINLSTPYILRSKFSVNGGFNIYKKDTLYNTTNANIALIYNLNKNHAIKSIAYHKKSTVLGNANINSVESYSKRLYGISYLYQPSTFLSKNKLSIELNYLIGTRNAIETNNNQSKGLAIINYLWNLNHKNQIFIKNTTEFLNTSNIFENELFQIGGVNSIRGFDDQSILTSNYNITNVTYRLYTNASNYLYSISDFGFIENQLNNSSNTIVGLGIGYNFKSNNSIVNISYAIGKTENQPFKMNNGKVHILFTYNF